MLHKDVNATDVLNQVYAGPTYRLGQVFSLLRDVGTERAEMVGETLKDNWSKILRDLSDSWLSFGSTTVDTISASAKSPVLFKDDGIVVLFPEISAHIFKDSQILLRPSITVCIPPNHSKIWIRISYIGEESLNDGDLEHFFIKAQELSVKTVNILLEYYKSSLKQSSVKTKLEKMHEIEIEMASGNLERTANLLKSENFSLKDLFKNNAAVELHGAFKRIFGREVSSIEELNTLSSKNQWFKINKDRGVNLLGICSKQHDIDSSKYICIMHNSGKFKIQPYVITKESSKLLLRQVIVGI